MENVAITDFNSSEPMYSPALTQYRIIKRKYSDCIILFQIGEFYEIFFNDVYSISNLLGLSMSIKSKQKVPMCGIPRSSLEFYIYKLLKSGHKVALATENTNDKILQRSVIRIYTRGTVVEDSLLESNVSNYILSYIGPNDYGTYAICDISTGEIYVGSQVMNIENLLSIWEPVECLAEQSIYQSKLWQQIYEWKDRFNFIELTDKYIDFAKSIYEAEVLSEFNYLEILAIGIIIEHISYAYQSNIKHLKLPIRNAESDSVYLESFTMTNLEIFKNLQGLTKYSLFDTVNRTITPAGSRLLKARFRRPSKLLEIISDRLDGVEYFYNNKHDFDEILKNFGDVERIMARLGMQKCTLQDLNSIQLTLHATRKIHEQISDKIISNEISKCAANLTKLQNLLDELDEIFILHSAMSADEGGFIKPGYNSRIDEIRKTRTQIMLSLDLLKERYERESGLNCMELRLVNNLGFVIELPKSKSSQVLYAFKKVQDLKTLLRYSTDELELLSTEYIELGNELQALEKGILNGFFNKLFEYRNDFYSIATSIGAIDIAYSMARLAKEQNYTRPNFIDENVLIIKNGRHLVLDMYKQNIVQNDCILVENNHCMLMTGPNMSGKTTYLKQNAIITLLAHVGLYVPADEVTLGIVDAIFVRIGAHDNLTKNMSTFMVEMCELSQIFKKVTNKSLVIIDEIGRGTNSLEGQAIACSSLEGLHNAGVRTIFATHYTNMSKLITGVHKVQMETLLTNNIEFTHRVIEGCADSSYALLAGQKAGLSPDILKRAAEWYLMLN